MTNEDMIAFLKDKALQVGGADKLARWITEATGCYCSYPTAYAWVSKRKVIGAPWKRLIELALEGGAKKV